LARSEGGSALPGLSTGGRVSVPGATLAASMFCSAIAMSTSVTGGPGNSSGVGSPITRWITGIANNAPAMTWAPITMMITTEREK
jgi:hypothetical protein